MNCKTAKSHNYVCKKKKNKAYDVNLPIIRKNCKQMILIRGSQVENRSISRVDDRLFIFKKTVKKIIFFNVPES